MGEMMTMLEAAASIYGIGFCVTFGAFISSNRITGLPIKSALLASALWPAWWMVMGTGGFR